MYFLFEKERGRDKKTEHFHALPTHHCSQGWTILDLILALLCEHQGTSHPSISRPPPPGRISNRSTLEAGSGLEPTHSVRGCGDPKLHLACCAKLPPYKML